MVLYQFVDGVSANIMVDRFNVVVFMMCEYVDIVVDFLISKDKLFSWYIFTLNDSCVHEIMDGFLNACDLSNAYNIIDGSLLHFSKIE